MRGCKQKGKRWSTAAEMQHNQFITMQHSPHGVELQWQARERVAGDGAATGLLLEQIHDLFHVGSVQKASLQVPLLTILQQRPDVTTDVVIILDCTFVDCLSI